MLFLRRLHNPVSQVSAAGLIIAMAVFLLSFAARAATITGYSVIVSRLAISAAADHEIKFVTPSGVGASSDTITIAYESGFDLSAIAVGDVDFAVDTSAPTSDCGGSFTDKTLASSAATSPTWGAAVSGTTLTLTPPTDAGAGEVPAGACVRIRIGQNSSAGGTGTNRIANPSTASAYTVSVAGGFGDAGLASVPIVSGDQISVTATVISSGGGGGGGSGGQPSAPTIFNVRALNITETEADILWDTDIASSSTVDYGLTSSYGATATASGTVFNHSVHLAGLTPGSTYHYRVRSAGAGTPEASSGDFTFTTLDATGPVITNVQAILITGTGARITWDTNEDADSRVEYGTALPYAGNVSSAALVNSHALDLTGLIPDTVYHYRVISKDASGNATASADFVFRTADTLPPTISNIFVDAITQTSARINWTTDELADSAVRYGLTSAYGLLSTNANLVGNHQVVLVGLAAGTTYHFSVSSTDVMGNGTTSTDQVFTTLPDATPPANISGLAVTPGDGQNALAWTNPGDADFAGVKIQRSTTGYPANPTEGTTVYDGAGVAMVDTGLTNGVTYYYAVFAYDASGNFASGAIGSGTPFGQVLPPPPGPACGNNACEPPETPASCPVDCPSGPSSPAGPACGNNACEAGEDPASCPADCPLPVSQPVNRALIRLFALSRTLELHADAAAEHHILPSRSLTFFIPATALPRPAASMTLRFAAGTYLFSRTAQSVPEEGYVADVSSPPATGRFDASIVVVFEGGGTETVPVFVRVEPFGTVMSAGEGGPAPLEGSMVLLQKFVGTWIDWDAVPYQQNNPVMTGSDGAFAFMAPPGQYRLVAKKEGYRPYEGAPFVLATEVVNPSLEAIALPPTLAETIVPGAPVVENAKNIAKAIAAQGAYVAKVIVNEVIEDPRVEAAATQIAVPAAAAVTGAVLVTAVQASSLANYLYFLITQPLLLLGRRTRKEFGVIYDSLTKLPIDLASVRLFAAATNRIVRTAVTDRQGRYSFLVEQGSYRLEAAKAGYVFPSRFLAGQREDGRYLDLYGGEKIEVSERGAAIAANVPLDPLGDAKTDRRVVLEEIGRRLQNALAFSSVVFTLMAALLYRNAYLYAAALIQLLLYFLFRRLARPPRPKNWGIVYDERTKKPVPFAVARIVETRYNKTLESRATDSRGRYNFLVGDNRYYVTVQKPGYETAKTPEIDLTAEKKGESVVAKDIPLRERPQEPVGPER